LKNPNGYGSVVKLSVNRRRPFVARKTTGWNAKSHPIYAVIGYFATREDAMIALAQYNNAPWDVDQAKLTLAEFFEMWRDKKGAKLGDSSQRSLYSAFHHCRRIHKMPYKKIKSFHMQECIDNCGKGYSTQGAIKNLFGHLDRFALELDIITRSYSGLLTSAPTPETNKTPFTDEEIQRIWGAASIPWVDSVLVLLYTGFRISELLTMRVDSVNLAQGTMQGGVKTKAGKNRLLPIHNKILPFVEKRLAVAGEYVFEGARGKNITVDLYYRHWNNIMTTLSMEHTPHECRHTFRSRLDSAGANKRCIDLIMGHKSHDVGERIYTHKTVEELKAAIELLNY